MKKLFDDGSLSRIGLGTWQLGLKGWGQGYEGKELVEALSLGIKNGLNFIDTAEIYGGGKSEILVGEALGEFERKQFFIATKIAGFNASARRVRKSLTNSLKRMKLEYVDLYQVHWEPSAYTNVPELFIELERLANDGLIKHIGVSNFSTRSIEVANDSMREFRVESNQIKFNLVERPSYKLMEFMKENDVKLIAWSPLGQGFLSGKYSINSKPAGGVRRTNKLFSPSNFSRFDFLLKELQRISTELSVNPTQLVLAYEKRLGVLPIPGFKNAKQVTDIVEANAIELSEQNISAIDAAVKRSGYIETSTGFYPKALPNFLARLGFLLI